MHADLISESHFSTVTLDRDTCTQRPTCSQQPATGSQVAGGKHSNTYRTTPYHTTSMDINQDRAYDLDLQSLLPPTPGAQGSVPAAHIDGWLGHVEPGGLRHDEIVLRAVLRGINPRSVTIFRGRDIRIVQSALH